MAGEHVRFVIALLDDLRYFFLAPRETRPRCDDASSAIETPAFFAISRMVVISHSTADQPAEDMSAICVNVTLIKEKYASQCRAFSEKLKIPPGKKRVIFSASI
jgi:hypothetical protein